MRQQDIVCCYRGKFILKEQERKDTDNIKCSKSRYETGVYSAARDEFC